MKWFVSVMLFVCVVLTGCAPCSGHKEAAGCCSDGAPAPAITETEVAALFERWNAALQTGDPKQVVANYAERSILLPTVSNRPRLTPAEKEDYFQYFLEKQPVGHIDLRWIDIGSDMIVDAGLYTFTFPKTGESVSGRYSFTYRHEGGEWLISSHHSSAMPE